MDGPRADEKAHAMADVIESFLGNPLSKMFLGFITKRDGRGRRIERLLMDYAGLNVSFSLEDRLARMIFRAILSTFMGRMQLTEVGVRNNLMEEYWRKGRSIRGPKQDQAQSRIQGRMRHMSLQEHLRRM